MGRPKIPDEIKAKKGTLRKCRQTESLKFAELDKVAAPSFLSNLAKRIFREKIKLVKSTHLLTYADVDNMMMYATAMDNFINSTKKLNDPDTPRVFEVYGKQGLAKISPSPYFKIQNDAFQMIQKIGSLYGFSPVSRISLANSVSEEKPHDDFDNF